MLLYFDVEIFKVYNQNI